MPNLSPAEAEQSVSQAPSQAVSDVGSAKAIETQKREDRSDAAEAMKVRETNRLLRWLNESALWTGTDERTRVRSIRFR
jgi:hypothetical protein